MKDSFFEKTKIWGDRILILGCILEILFFFNLWNIIGCIMTIITWIIFSRIFLKRQIIRLHPFSFLVFLSMSLYRILPLFATLLERKPISYKFENATITFILETFLYIISALAFYFSIKKKPTNNFIQKILLRYHFYTPPNPYTLWILGFIGVCIKLIFASIGKIETGNILGKFFITFSFFQYAPLILLFPNLYIPSSKKIFEKKKNVLLYTCFLLLLSFSGNSREALLEPIGSFILLYLLALLKSSYSKSLISKRIIIGGGIIAIFILPILTDISDAMLINRGIRSEVSSSELFTKTLDTFLDKEKLEMERKNREEIKPVITNYKEGWTEEYLNNFAFNRYCNMRITDITLFHANHVGFNNEIMKRDWGEQILKLFPSPILEFFNLNIDKTHIYSRGDLLFATSTHTAIFPGLRVTSHVADGLATFGYLYFLIQFFLFLIQFKLLDCYIFYNKGKVIYSVYGLICIFDFLGMFRNANGCIGEVGFIVRGFIQSCLIFILTYTITNKIASYINPYNHNKKK